MKRSAIPCLLLIAAIAGCGRGEEPPVETEVENVEPRIARIVGAVIPSVAIRNRGIETSTLAERMEAIGVPGVSIAVIADGAIDWARGYGLADVEGNRPVTPATLFQAASLSKPVAALAALRLVHDGALDLDSDVNSRLRSWKVPENDFTRSHPVTLRGLLSHSAGLTVHWFPGYERSGPIPSTVQVLEGDGNTEPVVVDRQPSSGYRYSGGGYVVMQLLLNDAAGKPFPAIAKETVLDPIGMSDSTFEQPLPEALHDRAATGYRSDGAEVEGKWHVYPETAAAGLWTTPSDLARYIIAVQKSRAGVEGAFLPAGLAGEMLTPVIEDHGLGPALQANGTRFAHGGANEGYRAVFTALIGRDEGVVIMANSDGAGPLLRELLITIAREYGWPGIEPMVKDIVDLGESVYRSLEGTYAIEGIGEVSIDYVEGELWADIPGGRKVQLLPESDTDFFMLHDGRPVVFIREGDAISGFESAGLRARKVD